MKWFSISLTKSEIVNGAHGRIMNAYRDLWGMASYPEDMILAANPRRGANLLNTPKTMVGSDGDIMEVETLLKSCRGVEVPPPDLNGYSLVIGHQGAFKSFLTGEMNLG